MAQNMVIRAGRALVGLDLASESDVDIVVRDGLIERIQTDASRSDDDVVDATGLTVVPGFIDTHVHIGFFEPAEVLFGGVTAVRDLAWPPDRIWPLVEASVAPGWTGPSIRAVGPMLTAPGGYPLRAEWAPPGTGLAVTDPEHAREVVAEVVTNGPAAIKVALNPPVGPVLDAPTLKAIVTAANEAGLNVTAHIHGIDELDKAIECGVDELAHMLMGHDRIPDDMIETMCGDEMVVVPTLAIRSGAELDVAIDNLARFAAGGGRVLYGTDLGNEGPRPGIDPSEIGAMSAAGISPREIIRSATVAAAHWIGLDSVGVLAPGYRADLVGVAGDPFTDPSALARVEMVVKNGERVR